MRDANLACGFLAVVGLCVSVGVTSAQDPRQEFLDRYAPHAATLAARYTRIKYREVTRTPQGPTREQVMTVSGMFDFDHYLARSETDEIVDLTTKKRISRGQTLDCRNTQYFSGSG